MNSVCVDAGTWLILSYSPAQYQSGSWGSAAAIFLAHNKVLHWWCRCVDGCIYLPSANRRQLTCVCVYICVCVCIALWIQTDKGQQLCRPWFTCICPKLVWNVIYLHHASPCALKTKIFIELPTTLHYLLTTSSTHCLVAVLIIQFKTSSLWHPASVPFGFCQISSHLLPQ